MKVRVKVDEAGYFDLRFRKEGEVFDIPSEQQFSERWMEKVEPAKPVDPPAPPVAVEPPAPPADPVAVEPPAPPADPVPPVKPKVEPPVEPKTEAKTGAEPKSATGDQKVL